MSFCHCCGQPVTAQTILTAPRKRKGGLLTPREWRIFDTVLAAPDGIGAEELFNKVMPDDLGGRRSLALAIWLMNKKLRPAGCEIWSGPSGRVPGVYRYREHPL